MAADKQDIVRNLTSNIEKALRRGKKLEKTLLKVIVQSEPGSAAEDFLKAVQQGLKALKKEARKVERKLKPETTKAAAKKEPAPKPKTAEAKPKRTPSRPRKKAPATPKQEAGTEPTQT